jgi:alanine dehydrogenase
VIKISILTSKNKLTLLKHTDAGGLIHEYDVLSHDISKISGADIILSPSQLSDKEIKLVKNDAFLISYFNFANNPNYLLKLLKKKITCVGIETIPEFNTVINYIKAEIAIKIIEKSKKTLLINRNNLSEIINSKLLNSVITDNDKYSNLLEVVKEYDYIVYTTNDYLARTNPIFTKKMIAKMKENAVIINLNSNLGLSCCFFKKKIQKLNILPMFMEHKYCEIDDYSCYSINYFNDNVSKIIFDFLKNHRYELKQHTLIENGKIINKEIKKVFYIRNS